MSKAPLLVIAVVGLAGCSETNAQQRANSAAATSLVSAPAFTRSGPPGADPSAPDNKPPAPEASAAPEESAAPEASAAASVEAQEEPLPAVTVKNIGMHIGGGPNNAATKRPIWGAVQQHFDDMKRCFAMVDNPKKGGTFGVDILIKGEGGTAEISKPRNGGLKGDGVTDCMVKVFEAVEFKRPPKGVAQKVSYSVELTPKK